MATCDGGWRFAYLPYGGLLMRGTIQVGSVGNMINFMLAYQNKALKLRAWLAGVGVQEHALLYCLSSIGILKVAKLAVFA